MHNHYTAHGHPHPDAPEPPPLTLEAAIDAALAALKSKTATAADRYNAASNLAEAWDHQQELTK